MIHVHDVIEAVYPMSEYLVTRKNDKAIESLVQHYWYVVTKVDFDYVYMNSYYISAEGYVIGDMRNVKFERRNLESIIQTNNKYKYKSFVRHK